MRKTAAFVALAVGLLAPAARSQTAGLDELLAKAAKWDQGQSREPLGAISDAVRNAQGSAAAREMEQRFIAFLKSDATAASKDFICQQLGRMGSDASVPTLGAMVAAPATSDMARYALELIPGQAAGRALRDALAKTSGRTRIGIINSLGRRRDAASVSTLRPLAADADPATAEAALGALAEIADSGAIQALAQVSAAATTDAHRRAAEAYLKAADNLVERGNKTAAQPVYKKLYAAGEPPIVRAGALHGLIATEPQPVPTLLEALRGDDRLQAIAIRALAQRSAKQLLAELPKLPEAGRVRVLGVMTELRDRSALPACVGALKDSSQPVRLAALEGIGVLGDASIVTTVAAVGASAAEPERAAARASLARIPDKAVDLKIVEAMPGAEPALKLELIRAAGARGSTAAAPVLLKMARDANEEVRRESLRALRDTASSGDIAGLAALTASPVNPGDRAEAARSLTAALRRADAARIQDVLSAYSSAGDPAAKAALLQAMGPAGNPQALPALRGALKEENPELKRAAILALTDWPDGVPVADLFDAARTASNPAHQVLALRGAIKLAGLAEPARSPAESVKLLADAMGLARQVEEKRAVLALLPKYPTRESLELARASLNDPQVAAEAKSAVTRLERAVGR